MYALFDCIEIVPDTFESKIFPIKVEGAGFSDIAHVAMVPDCTQEKVSDHSNLKILSPKQMLQRLPVAFAKVKAGNTSENLLHEIRQIVYSLY